jgi:methyl-accepting chemotaxis protein
MGSPAKRSAWSSFHSSLAIGHSPFSTRYIVSLLFLPAVVPLALALLFLTQVEQLSTEGWWQIIGIGLTAYLIGALMFVRILTPEADEVNRSVEADDERVSEVLSRCLRRTISAVNVLWLGSGTVFAVLSSLFVAEHFFSVRHFAVAALIAAAVAIGWSYVLAKHLLLKRAAGAPHLRYVGRHRLSVTRKIAIVFIGLFLVFSVATVQLVSTRVSQTLEWLAIASSAHRFAHVFDTVGTTVTEADLQKLQATLPPGFDVFAVRGGRLVSLQPDLLTGDEIRKIAGIGTGNSTHFMSPHVTAFRSVGNGTVMGVRIPWQAYSRIPVQIASYTFGTALITAVLFAAATFWLSRDIKRPLKELRRVAAELAAGNFTAEGRIFADDDVGALADSFGETRDNLRRLMTRIGGSGAVIADGVHVITGGTGALVTRSRQQAELTEDSTSSLDTVRSGIGTVVDAANKVTDLTEDTSSRALELQASAEEIARSMDYLFQSVEKSSSSTTEMNASAVAMSERTDVLARVGDEVLSFVAEMDSTSEELKQNAEMTAGISREVREAAATGDAAVSEAVDGIHRSQTLTQGSARVLEELQNRIDQIHQILRVIEDVTEQTNLLALNASIIAAQAGEHGRGFNIVAREIRELAERTRGSTNEIGAIIGAIDSGAREAVDAIRTSVERANANVTLARNASQSLQRILSSADRSQDMATRISNALGDQAEASRHLHAVTSRMSDHIAEINRSTREQARGTQLLAEEAERVREIALMVRTSTDQQSGASRGISSAMEQMAADAARMRDLLRQQLSETDRIAGASKAMLEIALDNDAVAQEFNRTVETLVRSGTEFEAEVKKFRV